jgi:hypothetical protein
LGRGRIISDLVLQTSLAEQGMPFRLTLRAAHGQDDAILAAIVGPVCICRHCSMGEFPLRLGSSLRTHQTLDDRDSCGCS